MTSEPERHEGDGGHGGTLSIAALADRSAAVLEAAWRGDGDGGFCVPNPTTYPWQWLWDSCFHAVAWAHLGDERAAVELATALSAQDSEGFVPHMRYGDGPYPHADLWGRADASSITQPPMYGHAVAELRRLGMDVDDGVVGRARAGLAFLLERRRRTDGGLVEVCHPWESGCDDSPRWDDTVSGGRFEWKGALVGRIERSAGGAPIHNPSFAVGSVGFSALVAWNAAELAEATGDRGLAAQAQALAAAVGARWDAELRTWVDDGPTAVGSGRVRTLDALLPLLVAPRPDAFVALVDRGAHGAPFGPRGVHRAEPCYSPRTYWRGSAWPQLTYLLWLAATRSGDASAADLSRSMVAGALSSGFAEHWDPETGAALGAVPQSWTSLVAVVAAG